MKIIILTILISLIFSLFFKVLILKEEVKTFRNLTQAEIFTTIQETLRFNNMMMLEYMRSEEHTSELQSH